MIIKTVFEIALSYGFDYDKEEERIYILTLISVALSNESDAGKLNRKLDALAKRIDLKEEIHTNMDSTIRETSNVLSDSLLVSKFIQGLPIVGVLGGLTNYKVINNVSNLALIKYKKRYLIKNK